MAIEVDGYTNERMVTFYHYHIGQIDSQLVTDTRAAAQQPSDSDQLLLLTKQFDLTLFVLANIFSCTRQILSMCPSGTDPDFNSVCRSVRHSLIYYT